MNFFSKLLNLFLSFFKKNKTPELVQDIPAQIPEIIVEEEKKVDLLDPIARKATKIALIIGHTNKSQGAVNYKGESEFVFNSRIADKVKKIMKEKYPNKSVKLFFREEGYYSTAVTKVGEEIGKWKAKISLELHFNSLDKVAYGCEILIWDGSEFFDDNLKIADKITDNLSKKFNLRQRNKHQYKDLTHGDGVKILKSKERGALNIKACNDNGVKIAMLIEPCFANVETNESKAIFDNEDSYAEFLADELARIDV